MSLLFLSTRNRGVTADLMLIETELRSRFRDKYKFYLNAENSANKLYSKSSKIGRENIIDPEDNIICIDGSLPAGTKSIKKSEGKRVLIPMEYDFQFSQLMSPADKKRKSFNAFTHIISPSPLTTQLLEAQYTRPKEQEIVTDYCAPFAHDLATNDKLRDEIRERFYKYYPEARGKKIVSIFKAGRFEEDEETPISDFDLSRFLDGLGSGCFVITNSLEILKSAAVIKNERKDSFCFANGFMKNNELLYITDVLISNHSYMMSVFAARRKPIYILRYKDKGVELYLKKLFPSLAFDDYYAVAERIKEGEYTQEHEKLNSLLSYPPDKNIIDYLAELFK